MHKLSDTQSILMYHSVTVVKVKKIVVLSFSKLSFKVASAYMLPQSSDICLQKVAKQKHLGCKKVRGQSEATLQTGMCDQKL